MNEEEYKNIYKNELSHWWYNVLDDLVEYFVKTNVGENSVKILDAGCGTGRMISKLSKYGNTFGIDASPTAIEICKTKGLSNVKIADLNEWHSETEFNVIISLDVLYHQSFNNIDKIVKSFRNALVPNGILILNLPAFNILRREHDKIVGGNKRFRKKEIKNNLIKNGFQLDVLTYRLPLIFKYILIKKMSSTGENKSLSDLAPVFPPLNKFMHIIHKFENDLIKLGISIPYGSSIFIVAKKYDNKQNSDNKGQKSASSGALAKLRVYIKSKSILNQFFKYSFVGVANTIIGLSVIYLLFNIFHLDYILSNIGGYAVGLVNSFIWNRQWTFYSSQHYSKEVVPFLIVFGISYAVNLLVVVFAVEFLMIHPNLAQLVGIIAYSSTNFLLNRKWTFRSSK